MQLVEASDSGSERALMVSTRTVLREDDSLTDSVTRRVLRLDYTVHGAAAQGTR